MKDDSGIDLLHSNLDISSATSARIEDVVALMQLPKLSDNKYLPWTSSAIRPSSLQLVLNEICIHRKKKVVEFGSGVSTLYISKVIEGLDVELYSIDHDNKWQSIVKKQLDDFGISRDSIHFIHAPLSSCIHSKNNLLWYDQSLLDSALPKKNIDIILVDGPLAYQTGHELARFPALPYLREKLTENFTIFLDDCNRQGEMNIIHEWAAAYDLTGSILGQKGNIAILFPKNINRFNIM